MKEAVFLVRDECQRIPTSFLAFKYILFLTTYLKVKLMRSTEQWDYLTLKLQIREWREDFSFFISFPSAPCDCDCQKGLRLSEARKLHLNGSDSVLVVIIVSPVK
jgi:hypothetical protein